jgi:predicted MFS family arabinose efflux permease
LTRLAPGRQALILAGGSFVALGLARFAYALVLPSMRSDLDLSYGAAGLLGTANTAGYLLGLLALPSVTRWGSVTVFRVGVLVTAVSIVATGLSRWYPVLVVARASAGAAGAAAFVLGSALAASLQTERGDAVVIFSAGAGLGIVIAGAVLPPILQDHPDRWPWAWFVLGTFGLLAAAAVLRTSLVAPRISAAAIATIGTPAGTESLRWLRVAYACFGAGYIVYVTFLVSTLQSQGASVPLISAAFMVLGAMTLVGPLLWQRPIATWAPRRLMAASMAMQAIGATLLLAGRSSVVIIASVAVFGSAFLLTPAIVAMTVRSTRPQERWASTIGALTVPFAATQAAAPWLSGIVIDRVGVGAGPAWTVMFSALGAACALAIGRRRRTETSVI